MKGIPVPEQNVLVYVSPGYVLGYVFNLPSLRRQGQILGDGNQHGLRAGKEQ